VTELLFFKLAVTIAVPVIVLLTILLVWARSDKRRLLRSVDRNTFVLRSMHTTLLRKEKGWEEELERKIKELLVDQFNAKHDA